MTRKPVRGLFITGTDTEVGKTYVTALVARSLVAAGHRVGVYKPAASGGALVDGRLVSDDALALWQAAGRPRALAEVCPQVFAAPLAPHLAAQAEGKQFDARLLRAGLDAWLADSEVVLVEGAGGLMSPLGDDEYVADLAYDFGFPLVIVAPNTLGVINQVLQTAITAEVFRRGLSVAGIVMNTPRAGTDDPSRAQNVEEIRRRAVPPVLAEVAYRGEQFTPAVDWFALARPANKTKPNAGEPS